MSRKTIILCLVCCLLLFSACTRHGTEDGERLVMLAPCSQQADLSSVEKAADKITREKLGIGFDMQFIDDSAYDRKLNMKVLSKSSDYDVMFVGHLSKYAAALENNALSPLNSLIEEYAPSLTEAIPSYLLDDIAVDGEIYAIPNEQVVFYQYAYFIQKDLAEKYGWEKERIERPEELEPFLESVKQNEPNIYPYNTDGGTNTWLLNRYEEIADGVVIPTEGDYRRAIFKFDTPEYIEAVKTLRRWYQKGYIRQDVMAVGANNRDLNENRYAVYSARWKPGAEAQIFNQKHKEYIAVLIGNSYMRSRSAQDTMLAVNVNSRHKAEAIQLIELLNTDKEFYNLIAFGIEGRHYKRGEDGKITLIADAGYSPNAAWRFGNQFNAYLLEEEPDGIWEETRKINTECKKSPIRGLIFSGSEVAAQLQRIGVVSKEYNGIVNGSSDYTVLWDDMIKSYEEVGIGDVLDEVQNQLDLFFSKRDAQESD